MILIRKDVAYIETDTPYIKKFIYLIQIFINSATKDTSMIKLSAKFLNFTLIENFFVQTQLCLLSKQLSNIINK